jgi:hypothetical protein
VLDRGHQSRPQWLSDYAEVLYVPCGAWPYTVAFSQLVEGSGPEQVHGLELAAITFASLAAATIGATRNNPFHLNFQWRLLPRMPRNRRRVR